MNLSALDYFDIQKEYDRLNKLLFNGVLLPVKLIWERAKLRGGRINSTMRAGVEVVNFLSLDETYLRPYEALIDILAHEMIHVYIAQRNIKDWGFVDKKKHHGQAFIALMNDINKQHGLNIKIKNNPESYPINIAKDLGKEVFVFLIHDLNKNNTSVAVLSDLGEYNFNISNYIKNMEALCKRNKNRWVFYIMKSRSKELKRFPFAKTFNNLRHFFISDYMVNILNTQSQVLGHYFFNY